jgi:hypothetical protein
MLIQHGSPPSLERQRQMVKGSGDKTLVAGNFNLIKGLKS